jgi:hypothetical protein
MPVSAATRLPALLIAFTALMLPPAARAGLTVVTLLGSAEESQFDSESRLRATLNDITATILDPLPDSGVIFDEQFQIETGFQYHAPSTNLARFAGGFFDFSFSYLNSSLGIPISGPYSIRGEILSLDLQLQASPAYSEVWGLGLIRVESVQFPEPLQWHGLPTGLATIEMSLTSTADLTGFSWDHPLAFNADALFSLRSDVLVPEPTSLALLLWLALSMPCRRRRRAFP